MRFPISLYSSLGSAFISNLLRGRRKFPLVLMLEPTHRCNLSCAGCDRIRLYREKQADDLTLDQCIGAAEESGAPVVTVTGGEPMLYPELEPLVGRLLSMKRHVYLCTNGLLADPFLDSVKPSPQLTLNFHLDGMAEMHDRITGKEGNFRKTIEVIKKAKRKGFRVSTNTSVFRTSERRVLEQLFSLLTDIGVDGILVSPAFSYERVENDIFLSGCEAIRRFREMSEIFGKYPFINSPIYVDFLKGERKLSCTPWGNPTRNPLGWKSPCYLITDAYYPTFREMMTKTKWNRYGTGADPRCANCMVHSGYEATSMRAAFSNPRDLLRLLLWNFKRT